jgi:hypothetical protein
MRYLEKFLNALCENKLFLNCQPFVDFLKIEDENEFMNKKKEYLKTKQTQQKLSDLKVIDGKLRLKISKEIEVNTDTAKNYIMLNEQLLQRLGISYKNLFLEMNTVSLRLKEISDTYDQLHIVSFKTSDVRLINLE